MHIYYMIQEEQKRIMEIVEEIHKTIGNIHHYLEYKINDTALKNQEDKENKELPVDVTLYTHCPKPSYNQIVFRLLPEGVYILWMLPSKKCLKALKNGEIADMPESVSAIVEWCHMFNEGLLQKMAANLAKMLPESLMLIECSKLFHKRETKTS